MSSWLPPRCEPTLVPLLQTVIKCRMQRFKTPYCLFIYLPPPFQDVASLEELVVVVRPTSEALITLAQLSDMRQEELINASFKQRLQVSNETLRKSAPLLVTALRTYVQNRDNDQARAGRDYAVDQVVSAAHEIIVVVSSTDLQESRSVK